MMEKFEDRRLSLAWAQNNIYPGDQQKILECWKQWADQPLYYILRKESEEGPHLGLETYVAIRARKRGDEEYARQTLLRFRKVVECAGRISVRIGRKYTTALLATFTYAKGVQENWDSVGHDWNLFISRIRRRYGKCLCIRIWESQKSGNPHIHALLIFTKCKFRTFIFRNKIRLKDKDDIASFWPHGFTDIQGIYDYKGALGYLVKYLTKTLYRNIEGAEITIALCWFYRKRAFAISNDLITHMRNSNAKSAQWSFIGLCTSCVDLSQVFISYAKKTEKGVLLNWSRNKQEVIE